MKIKKRKLATTIAALSLLVASCSSGSGATGSGTGGDDSNDKEGSGEEVTLTIESWRSDDLEIWQDKILPEFEKDHPNIKVTFSPSPPAEYDGNLAARLEGGTAGDIITCRPFDKSLALFDDGHLSSLSDLEGIDNFSEVAQSAWITDDGKDPFCVPMASVIHGFMYNKTAFDELGLEEPETEEEFFALLDAIKEDGTYTPLAIGLADQWESATVGFQNIGPNYWKGEEGRQGLISGDQKLTDDAYVDTFKTLARWNDYIDPQASAITYSDAQNQFTFGTGAIYPSGSWEINEFEANAEFELGVFRPPVPAGQSECYISDHTDIGIGLNANSENAEEAEIFLEWVAGSDFASIYSNALPGFFSLQDEPVELENELAQEFVSWRDECDSTIRSSFQILSRGEPNLEDELWATSSAVITGELEPKAATERLQEGLDSWYKP